MWWGSESDPGNSGGDGSKEPPQNQQLLELQEQFEQQQTFIAQLKEMLRKTEQSSSVSREKVEEYASTLNEINARAKLSKIKRSEGRKNDPEASSSKSSATIANTSKKSAVVTPAKEKINLLRQQLEENRVKLAERGKNQKDMEVMVNQIKAQLDESQANINDPPINIPKPESAIVTPSYSCETSKDDLLFAIKSKDDHIIELNAKVQQLQGNVLDLQENLKEKDSVIDARTKAITLLSENLSKKGKDTLDMLDETKEQMRNMQQNFVTLESQMKEENVKLQSELLIREKSIQELTEINLTLENNHSELQKKFTNLNNNYSERENKIIELNKLNEELQNKVREFETTQTSPEIVEQKEASSPQKSSKRKGSKKFKAKETAESKVKETVETTPQVSETIHIDRIAELEKRVEELQAKLEESKSTESYVVDSEDVSKLNKQLEEMNKNMIKMKAQHKAKLKEIQKKTTSGELNEKVTTLESENVKLGQRVAELEDEKGNLQLRLVDYESNKEKEYIADLENKIEEQKMEIENHIRTITSLESQITMSSNELSTLRSEFANLMHIENAQVCSEMTSVQLEEQLDKEVSQKKEIQDKYNEIVKENENLLEKIETLNKEKHELSAKLDQYMQENIDLIDRLEKLSAEKVSSAESIEIVDALTHQEKLEIEAYQKNLDFTDSDKPVDEHMDMEQNPELNESVSKLNEETSELMEKIKLFTVERREVMEKMDNLTAENQQLSSKLEQYKKDKSEIDEKYKQLGEEKEILLSKIDHLSTENKEVSGKLKLLSEEKCNDQSFVKIQDELIEYRAIVENQKLQIASLQEEIWNKSDHETETLSNDSKLKEINESLNSQLRTLQAEYESLFTSHENIKEDSKELINAKNKIIELECRIAENTEEINFLQKQLESNKEEIIVCVNRISSKDERIDILEYEAEELNRTIEQLNIELGEIEKSKNHTVASLSSQLSELKTIIAENFEQLEQYETEMNKNSQTSDELNEKLDELNYKIVETEHITEIKNTEINTLKQEKTAHENKIKSLENEIKQKNDNFAETCRQLKEKCKFLENQIEANTGSIDDIKGPLEAKIVQLETKNKDQVDKMKKIAANLKKKSNMCQELEGKLVEFKEKWENESKEKDDKQKTINDQQVQLNEHQTKIQSLLMQLQELNTELSAVQLNFDKKKSEAVQIRQDFETQLQTVLSEKNVLNSKLQDLEFIIAERDKLQQDLAQYTSLHDNLQRDIEEKNQYIQNLSLEINMIKSESESSNKQVIQNLTEELESLKIHHETSQNAKDAKLQEKDLFIENLEAENVKYKERVAKLEEGLSNIEERRQLLEQSALDLKVQLEEKSFVCEEVTQYEDLLERRLSALVAHDEIIEKKLEQSTTENLILTEKVKSLTEENDSLQQKLKETTIKFYENAHNTDKLEMLENDIARLNIIISSSESEIKKLQVEYERKLSDKNIEIESMEAELQSQLQELHAERKNLLNQCEVLQDNAKEYTENYQLLTDEMDQLKEKLTTTKQHLEDAISENQRYCESNEMYLGKITHLENKLVVALQNTSGFGELDTESLKTEINHLQNIINQKDIDIQNYQRQNMQLQMASFGSSSTASLFDEPRPDMKKTKENDKQCDILEQQILELQNRISSSDSELRSAIDKISELKSKHAVTSNELEEKQIMIDNLQDELAKLHEIERMYKSAQNKLKEKKFMIKNLQEELGKQQELLVRKVAEEGVAEIISVAEKSVEENIEKDTSVFDVLFQKQVVAETSAALEKPSVEVTREELLRKIRALEFMLFNVEKEKDDTLVQCHEFTNELARLVYERENLIKVKPSQPDKPEPDMQSLESLIVSTSEVDNVMAQTKDMHSLEFPPMQVQINKQNIHSPVVEELIESKKAYLCYTGDDKIAPQKPPEEGWGAEDPKIQESIDSLIVQVDATKITPEDKKLYDLLQYGQVSMPKDTQDHTTPVTDLIPDPKHAYVCYPSETKTVIAEDTFAGEEGWGAEDPKIQESIDSLIVQVDATKITPEDKKLYDLLQYGQVNIPKDTHDHTTPVTDLIPDPKHAYVCYPSETKTVIAEDTFAGEEDGWGWNAEDAKLEAEHRMSLNAAAVPQVANDSKIEQLEEKIHDLEIERSRLLEEIKSSQVRSGKLIKKLKLMKEKNDSLIAEANKKTSGDFFGLEMAIQDELNSQIKTLEKKIKELSEENSKEKVERENLAKKLEVITNANDRMVEMKEKQDNEIQFLHFKNRELSSKLEQLEWGDDSPSRSKTPTTLSSHIATGSEVKIIEQNKQSEDLAKKIAELNTIINDLTLDNEEMQCMLEEQRKMRLEAEKALSNRPVLENMKSEQEFLIVESENRNLHEELTKLNDVQQVLGDKFSKSEHDNKKLQEEISTLNYAYHLLEDKINEYAKSKDEITIKCQNLEMNIENLVQENQLLNSQYSSRIEQFQNENIELQNQLTNINIERESFLKTQVDPDQIAQLQNENIHLQNQLSNLNIERENLLKSQMDANQFEIIQLKTEITRLVEETKRLENILAEREQNLQNSMAKIQQLELDKNAVEIRLQEILNIQSADKTNDVKLQQMNEQLMTTLSNLDTKNKEIVELNNMMSNVRLESEQKLTITIEQLTQQWTERVDQRGNDVAESWKLHLESVENEFSQKEENLRTELNNLFKQNEELLLQNSTLQQQVQSLLSEKQVFVSDNNNTIESLQQSVNSKQTNISELLETIRNKETEICDLSQSMTNKETEIFHLSQNVQSKETKILELLQNIKNKETEILELAQNLQETSAELQLKNSEIINLQLTFEQMQSKEIEHQNYIQQFSQQLEERTLQCTELQEKLNELYTLSQEEEKEISDLKNMIENQVLKIEDLKKEIEQKDAEYNALEAEIRQFEASFLRPQEEKRQLIQDLSAEQQTTQTDAKDESTIESASRAELDLALYMLHQRDVRCEELTVELMQLLEERDTLQLKLSNAIRLNEEHRNKLNSPNSEITQQDSPPRPVKSTGAIPKTKSAAIVLGATGTELASEATEHIIADSISQDTYELANKLSQLHTIGYNRDKTLKDDQESRHIQQMSLMQQHRDLAAKLPPEAAAKLLDASYTVSRDVQSPSKVLLNWLWGRSTPKVNDV